ncbi:hypothetical protein HNR06_000377 [Nocardiopsis arvandica]|uniref:Uncharacterized protein n=1 Tax=Nocardiopsis sinuspersici TaxID=501010 RepID=A0A7Y9XA30_9ACTN|nr:hypothetical protein [Nocardiopsis sinuspersici]NYH50788.1 hypothetical protein [Nocardiopsis sinuspersici]
MFPASAETGTGASPAAPGPLTPAAVDAYVHDYLDASPLPGAAVASPGAPRWCTRRATAPTPEESR